MSAQHTVIDARTGKVLLANATLGEYDRWYDHHCFWRAPRDISEVQPEQRAAYAATDPNTHFLVEDEA